MSNYLDRESINYVVRNLKDIWKYIFFREKLPLSFQLVGRGNLSIWAFWHYVVEGFYDKFSRYVNAILNESKITLTKEKSMEKPHRARKIKTPQYKRYRMGLPVLTDKVIATHLTPENKFLAYFLDIVIRDLEEMKTRIKRIPDFSEKVYLEEKTQNYLRITKALRARGFLREIEQFPQFHFTQTMIKNPLYSMIFGMYLNYYGNLVESSDAHRLELSMLKDYMLFELYILFKLKDLITNLLSIKPRFEYHWKKEDILIEDEENNFLMEWNFDFEGKVELRYQQTIPAIFPASKGEMFSVSVWLRPDYIIYFPDSKKSIVVDAKHKSVLSREDIWQMHTYKDAIRIRDTGNGVKRTVEISLLIIPEEIEKNYALNRQLYNRKTIPSAGVGIIDSWELEEGEFLKNMIRTYL